MLYFLSSLFSRWTPSYLESSTSSLKTKITLKMRWLFLHFNMFNQFPVLSLLNINDTPSNCSHLSVSGLWVVQEVCGVQSERRQWKHSPLWCSCAADHPYRHTTLQPHKLWSVWEVVNNQGSFGGSHLYFLQILIRQCKLNNVKRARGTKEHDPHSAAFLQMTMGLLKRVDDGIFNPSPKTIRKLKGA